MSIDGNLSMAHNSTLQVEADSSLVIGGDIILSDTSSLSLTPTNDISVVGCATLNGTLRVILDSSNGLGGSFAAMNYSCRQGAFTRVESTTTNPCESSTASATYSHSQLQVSYSIDRSKCGTGFDFTIVYIIVAIIGVLIVATVIIILTVKPIRQRLMPYRDRAKFQAR